MSRNCDSHRLGVVGGPGGGYDLRWNDYGVARITYFRVYAIQALCRIKARDAVPVLCRTIESDAERLVLTNAIKALAELGASETVPALIQMTRHDNDFIRSDFAWALGAFRDARVVPALEALLSDKTKPIERDEFSLPTTMCSDTVGAQAQISLNQIGKRR